ncbi:MAG TPA: hypothetical protein VGH86_09730 [Phenylobacterium sp.]|jgi:hypothetical protein
MDRSHRGSRAFDPLAKMQPIRTAETATLGDHMHFPGCRFLLTCALCGWSKSYRVELMIQRLRELRAGGYATTLSQAAARVGWNCPACHRVKWRGEFAFPAGMDEREYKRLANLYRN